MWTLYTREYVYGVHMSTPGPDGRSAYRKNLSRDVVVREAMALLDEEGVEALTMRNLADRLDVVPNALYRHVRDKEDLLDAVLDHAVSLVPIPDPALDWRSGLAALAGAIRTTMLEHPSSGRLVVSRPALGPHGLALGEYGFGVMLAAGFPPEVVERGFNLVVVYALGFGALEIPRVSLGTSDATLDTVYDGLPADAFPHTLVIRPSGDEFVGESQFHFGLDRILDGLDLLLRA